LAADAKRAHPQNHKGRTSVFQSFQTPMYAGFWLRFAAYLIDSILLGLIFFPLGLGLGLIMGATGNNQNPELMLGLNGGLNMVSLVVTWLYSSCSRALPGRARWERN